MGGGASSFPELLTQQQIKNVAVSQYDDTIFLTLKDSNGTVPKKLFIDCFEPGPEREVFQLFLMYCPNGLISKSTFLSLCRVNKLLHKNTCTSKMAGDIFDRVCGPMQRGPDESPRIADALTYNSFRLQIVPEFAKLKNLTEETLIEKLSLCEYPSSVILAGGNSNLKPLPIRRSSKDYGAALSTDIPAEEATAALAADTPPAPAPEPVAEKTKSVSLKLDISAEFVAAFIHLQTKTRAKIAKRRVEALKEVRDIETGKAPRSRRPTIEPEPHKRKKEGGAAKSLLEEHAAMKKELNELLGKQEGTESNDEGEAKELNPAEIAENELHDLFDCFCNPPGQMDINFFKKFMRETYTVTKKFTVNDADAVFKKAIAKATSAPQNSHLRAGVFYGKRIDFYVFYHSAIPMVAKQRGGISTQNLIEFLNNANVAQRNRATQKAKAAVRRPSRDEAPKSGRRPSHDLPPARMSSKDNDPNPFARKSSKDSTNVKGGIAAIPRKSFDQGNIS